MTTPRSAWILPRRTGARIELDRLFKGVPKGVTDDVVVIPFNDAEAAERIIRANAADIAAVLLDAVPSYLGFVQATQRFTNMIERVTARDRGAFHPG